MQITISNAIFSQRIQDECPPVIGEETLTKRELRSEDRDKTLFPNTNDVTYDLGNTFENIETISIDPQGLEFPNTLDGITRKNNSVKWVFYSSPTQIYEALLPRGNYILDSLLPALLDQMNAVLLPQNRVFTVQFVRESRSISFTSYLNTPTPNNPFFIQANVPIIGVTMPDHKLQVGDHFLLSTPTGTSGDLGGLSGADLSGIFVVTTTPDEDHFTFLLTNDIPYNSGQLGGSNITVGRLDPFKFIHSETSILPQIGFVAEDSATICSSIICPYSLPVTTNGFLVTVSDPNGKHYASLGDNVVVGGQRAIVTQILDEMTLRVDVPLRNGAGGSYLENRSLTLLFLSNLCENAQAIPLLTQISGPDSDMIEKVNIHYVDNDRVIVRTNPFVQSDAGLQDGPITFRVSSPSVFGFATTQTSLINGVPLQYINLQGMTSVAITLPDIETNYFAKNVKRIWSKLQLSDQATSDLFNTQSSTQGTFEWPNTLSKLRIKIVTMQNEPVDFQGMNYSFTIYIKTKRKPQYQHKLYYGH